MVCQAVVQQSAEGVQFCSSCGAQVVATPPMIRPYGNLRCRCMYRSRGCSGICRRWVILWCIFGVYRIAGGPLGMFFVRIATMGRSATMAVWPLWRPFGPFGPQWMNAMLPLIATAVVISAGWLLLVGYSLLTRRPWGRTLAIIVAVLSLLKIPFGTALGIYTLWVLAPADSGAEYDSIADRT